MSLHCEAIWRIYGFDLHYRTTPVERLAFHMKGDQTIPFHEGDYIEDVLEKAESVKEFQFVKWMEYNRDNEDGRHLKYCEFPRYFVWVKNKREWRRRKDSRFAIGRIYHMPVGCGEFYYLRIMLNHKVGCKNFEDLRTVDHVVCKDFKSACYALGLLNDDTEYVDAIKEAAGWKMSVALRSLFVVILLSNFMTMSHEVWDKTWEELFDDMEYNYRKLHNNLGLKLNEEQKKNLTLAEIEKILIQNGSSLHKFTNMPKPIDSAIEDAQNILILDETSYDIEEMKAEHARLYKQLTAEQKGVYEEIMSAVDSGNGGVFFLYGYGGTGKTFMWKTLCAALRMQRKIVVAVASSDISSLLLSGGRTVHSKFGIPLQFDETSMCSKLKPGSDEAELLQKTSLIIWDKSPMAHKHCFEALDRSLRDIIRGPDGRLCDKPFGGKVVVFGGDFRQILSVVPMGSRNDIVQASLCSSTLWNECKVLRLTQNMRLQGGSSSSDVEDINSFANWLLSVGDGTAGDKNHGEVEIKISDDVLIRDSVNTISAMVDCIYPNLMQNKDVDGFFQNRAILAPTNEIVDSINEYVMSLFPEKEVEYMSSDAICKDEEFNQSVEDIFSSEFLNTVKCSGIPNHILKLKIGCIVMLLRNIDQALELCNGTRLIVTNLGKHVVEAVMLSEKNIGKKVLISRMIMSPSDTTKFPVRFQRRQFH